MTVSSSDDFSPEFFEQIVETVGVGVGVYDETGQYRYVNENFADLFGVQPDELIGTPLWEIVPEIEEDRFPGYWESFVEGKTRKDETRHEYNGVSVPVATVTTRHIIDGTPYHFGTIKNITERKRRERELKRQNERLDAFTSVVSHDLRNPLNVAQGYIEILEEDIDRDELALVDNALDRMESLISELLALAKSGDHISDTEPISLAEIAQDTWETVDTASATLQVTEMVPKLVAARSRLRQLLANLFRNAIQHGGENVTVTVGGTDDGFFVEDDGEGIPAEERGDVFNAGFTTNSDGTGFGLNIVDQIATAHDWDIEVTEGAQGGARFEITGVEFTAE